MKIKTTELTALVTRAIQATSNNRMLPITTLMCIESKSNTLTLRTTDTVNYLYVSQAISSDENFYAVVNADTFTRLISKMTCEDITLSAKDGVLEIVGNGKYKLEMYLDESGNVINFPNPINTTQFTTKRDTTVLVREVQLARNKCYSSLSEEISDVPVSEYSFSDCVITTDATRLSSVDVDVFNHNILLNSRFVDLICQSPEPELDVYIGDNYIYVESATYSIFCNKLSDVDKYPKVKSLITDGLKFEGECTISKSIMLSALDRLSLFISSTSQNKVHISFDTSGINLFVENHNNLETLSYIEDTSFTPFECDIDIELLMSQLKAFSEDTVTLYYANDTAIKMTQNNVTQILCMSV